MQENLGTLREEFLSDKLLVILLFLQWENTANEQHHCATIYVGLTSFFEIYFQSSNSSHSCNVELCLQVKFESGNLCLIQTNLDGKSEIKI